MQQGKSWPENPADMCFRTLSMQVCDVDNAAHQINMNMLVLSVTIHSGTPREIDNVPALNFRSVAVLTFVVDMSFHVS